MALEAVVYPQIPFHMNANNMLFYDGLMGFDYDHEEQFSNNIVGNETENTQWETLEDVEVCRRETVMRAKRRRSKSCKNKEDIENQRMTHIAVERNRRKQMNDYLSVLRSLMPQSYVQRGDQASIIGGAINYVKELEQQVQFLGVNGKIPKNKVSDNEMGLASSDHTITLPFSEFFTFPQYSTESCGVGDVEVTMVESHANLKIRSEKRPKQLLKIVTGLQSMRLTILHLNVTGQHQIVLYSLSVKVEDDCKLTSVDEIATAVYQILSKINAENITDYVE